MKIKLSHTTTLSFIGAGNVAWHLAHALKPIVDLKEIYSPGATRARELSESCQASYLPDLKEISGVDILILAVKDDVIGEVCNLLPDHILENTLIAHTSGTYGMEVYPDYVKRPGIFYPLNTFTRGVEMDLSDTPFFLDASNDKDYALLENLASRITTALYRRNGNEMPYLHLGAVFVNNFTNHIYHITQEFLDQRDIDFNKLLPLIRQTVHKLDIMKAEESQTGPAIRQDFETIKRHLELLELEDQKRLYALVSELILKRTAD